MDLILVDPLQIQGSSGPSRADRDRFPVYLQPPQLCFPVPWKEQDLFPGGNISRSLGTGDNRAKPLHGENSVHRQPEDALVSPSRNFPGSGFNSSNHFLLTAAGDRGNRNNRGILEEGAREVLSHILGDHLEPLIIDHISLGKGDHPVLDAQELTDIEVLTGLGHNPLIGSNDEKHQIDPCGTGDHVPDETFMARNIHEAQPQTGGECEGGKTQLDGNTPLFLLLETVGVDTG